VIQTFCVIKYKWRFAIGQHKKNKGNNFRLNQINHHQVQLQEKRRVNFTTVFQVSRSQDCQPKIHVYCKMWNAWKI